GVDQDDGGVLPQGEAGAFGCAHGGREGDPPCAGDRLCGAVTDVQSDIHHSSLTTVGKQRLLTSLLQEGHCQLPCPLRRQRPGRRLYPPEKAGGPVVLLRPASVAVYRAQVEKSVATVGLLGWIAEALQEALPGHLFRCVVREGQPVPV
ncbi:MAG: hypothetical protein NZ821_09740, partial [Gloeomargarita sp. SKYB31]|nr:hypothetical protein [Gloeomargarita sp. SKYB31]